MKSSYSGHQCFWHNNHIMGISLGADGCREHEVGIGEFAETLRVGTLAATGLDAAKIGGPIGEVHAPMLFAELPQSDGHEAEVRLRVTTGWRELSEAEQQEFLTARDAHHLPMGSDYMSPSGFTAAWDRHGFVIRAFDAFVMEFLIALHQAFKTGDVVLAVTHPSMAGTRPMTFFIASRVPEDIRDLVAPATPAHRAA